MKTRFPSGRLSMWRQRFLAIARELEATGAGRGVPPSPRGARLGFALPRGARGLRPNGARAG